MISASIGFKTQTTITMLNGFHNNNNNTHACKTKKMTHCCR